MFINNIINKDDQFCQYSIFYILALSMKVISLFEFIYFKSPIDRGIPIKILLIKSYFTTKEVENICSLGLQFFLIYILFECTRKFQLI